MKAARSFDRHLTTIQKALFLRQHFVERGGKRSATPLFRFTHPCLFPFIRG
jgi:hypothetical protein